MAPEVFVGTLAVGLFGLVAWGCRTLPREGWQILTSVPVAKRSDGSWAGVNVTWYGLLTATGYGVAATMGLLLLTAAGVPLAAAAALAGVLLAACVPASQLLARAVEGKSHGFTVGGAAFVGTVLGPWLALCLDAAGLRLGWEAPVVPSMAALAVAYACGEGVGRLACVSFGCCYGKPLDDGPPLVRRLFGRAHFVFSGKTKKIAYASGLDGRPVVPVQGLTAVLYVGAALAGTWLFLRSAYLAAFLLPAVVTHGWRFASEFLRADHRGGGRISAYQWMALCSVPYCLAAAALLADRPAPRADLEAGLRALWSPGVLLLVQALWFAAFLHTGRSTVTGAVLTLHVNRDRV